MAALIETAPWIVILERHRAVLFGASGALLALNHWIVLVRSRHCAPGQMCHIDSPFMRFNRGLYWLSLALFAMALVVTYGSVLVIKWMQ